MSLSPPFPIILSSLVLGISCFVLSPSSRFIMVGGVTHLVQIVFPTVEGINSVFLTQSIYCFDAVVCLVVGSASVQIHFPYFHTNCVFVDVRWHPIDLRRKRRMIGRTGR